MYFKKFKKFEIICCIEDADNKFTHKDDYAGLISEWISNGVNGTEEDVLDYCKPMTVTLRQILNGDQSTIACGIWEALSQSNERNNVVWVLDKDPSQIKITISHGDVTQNPIMKLPKLSFDDMNGIVLRGRFPDSGKKVRYSIKKNLNDFREMMEWMQNNFDVDKFDADPGVEEWIETELKKEKNPDMITTAGSKDSKEF